MQVGITTATVPDALVVPVTALLARSGGGYAVEVVATEQPSRARLARTVRRRRRACAGHRLTAGRWPRSGGPGDMTDTLPPSPDSSAVAAGNGSAIGGAGIPVLDVDDVTKSYLGVPPVHALRGVNLTIGQGELVGIVGPSGSGKTTLLQLMGTLDRPTSGRVRITGLDVAAMADEHVAYLRATRIGFIFQQFFLAEHSTAWTTSPTDFCTPASRSRSAASAPSTLWSWSAWPSAARPSNPALRRATTAGRDRPSPCRLPRHSPRRRADRRPRPGDRAVHPGTDRSAPPVRLDDRGHHPRPRDRRADAPQGRAQRRPGRRRQLPGRGHRHPLRPLAQTASHESQTVSSAPVGQELS